MYGFDVNNQSAANMDRVSRAISTAADSTGVDFDYLVNQARVESGFKSNAKASTSSATGLFQFTKQTWLATVKQHGAQHGHGWAAQAIATDKFGKHSVPDANLRAQILDLRNQPEIASLMAAEFASDNADVLTTATGRNPEDVDLYLAHFLGAAGASKFLNAWSADPNQSAANLFPEAAQANRSIFYDGNNAPRSLNEIRERFRAKMGGESQLPYSVAQKFGRVANTEPVKMRAPMELRSISPMPKGISIEFAREAYDRLASLNAGRS